MLLKKSPEFQSKLLSWYKKNARDLPWRRTSDPYKIWVSEIMLQQTQVDTVIPYYDRWLARFPDAVSLAKADSADVMKHWAGLGYYRRARMLHEGAKTVVAKGGRLPDTPAGLLEIPGIGRYTAGAIASIAFGVKTPVLDGNVIRILARLTAYSKDTGNPKNLEALWDIATALVPEKTPGDFNQAMMELGATVCLPKTPQCGACPVVSMCLSYKKGNPLDFPVKLRKEKITAIKSAALILKKRGKVLVQRQPAEARWGGLWMFPFGKDKQEILKSLEIAKDSFKHTLTLYHGFTKYKVQLDVYEHVLEKSKSVPLDSRSGFSQSSQRIRGNDKSGRDRKWIKVSELSKLAFPSPHQKILKHILASHG